MESVPDLPDVEPSLRDSAAESETSIKIRRPFHSFSSLERGGAFDVMSSLVKQIGIMIQRIGSTTWVIQSSRSTRNRIRALHAEYSQTPSLEKISRQQQRTCISEHLATPRDGSALHERGMNAKEVTRLLRETTSYS